MSFLAPLYLLAGLAVVGPILFHLIRRTPRGRQVFSSVMFLQPSPPRMTKRSRIEDWLLLLLRVSVLVLLAAAFARPFWRVPETAAGEKKPGRQITLLVDISASLQRDGLWDEVRSRVDRILEETQPEDSLSCVLFDSSQRVLVSAAAWDQLPVDQRAPLVRERLAEESPGWRRTVLDSALIKAAEELADLEYQHREARTIVLISDLQQGSHWEDLQGFAWPSEVQVQLLDVGKSASPTNAAIQVLDDPAASEDIVRVRVSNAPGSTESLFLLSWLDEFSTEIDNAYENATSQPVYVPAGQSRVIRAPERSPEIRSSRLVLTGDDHPFDNIAQVASRARWPAEIVWIGDSTTASLHFFLEPLFPETSRRVVRIVDWSKAEAAERPEEAALILCATSPDGEQLEWMRQQAQRGASVLYVGTSAEQTAGLFDLLGQPPVTIADASADDYFMLGQVDLKHPLMQPFDDPRFSDFTKLRFWKRRELPKEGLADGQVVWEFEDGRPALVQWPQGAGQVLLLAASWAREESELAVWSKFPPLMNALLEAGRPPALTRVQFTVGESLRLSEILSADQNSLWVQQGREQPRQLPSTEVLKFEAPGRWRIGNSSEEASTTGAELVVNLPPEESDTAPLSLDVLEAAGVLLESEGHENPSADAMSERQLLNRELEAQQQWWRWLLLTVLGLLVVETVIAGQRRSQPEIGATA
ncbi:MAG: BatA domain-containing protein [Planctomycetaceae bacterium]|nr:BatA domain-containing protein [Planctomycetaceae bacterium]